MMLSIFVNGEPRTVAAGTKLAELITQLAITPRQCAVEINQQLVPRGQHADRILVEGDRLEIVTLVGGG